MERRHPQHYEMGVLNQGYGFYGRWLYLDTICQLDRIIGILFIFMRILDIVNKLSLMLF